MRRALRWTTGARARTAVAEPETCGSCCSRVEPSSGASLVDAGCGDAHVEVVVERFTDQRLQSGVLVQLPPALIGEGVVAACLVEAIRRRDVPVQAAGSRVRARSPLMPRPRQR